MITKYQTIPMPPLYKAQKDTFFNKARYSVCEATTKGGKTIAALIWQASRVLEDKRQRHHWWVAPVYAQSDIAYRRAKKMFGPLCEHNDTEHRLMFPNGAWWWFKSGEKPDNLYGEDVADAVMDEFTRCREESWHAVRSTLTATSGPCRFIGNVKGRGNWGYKLARRAQEQHGKGWYEYHRITAPMAADGIESLKRQGYPVNGITHAEIEQAREDLPDEVFRELYMCEPADDGGNPFGIAAIHACRIDAYSDLPTACFGIDLAKSYDWTWVVGLDENGCQTVSERWQADWNVTRAKIIDIIGHSPAMVDATGVGDVVFEDLSRERPNVEGFKFSAPSKQDLMSGLRGAIHKKELGIADERLISELEIFQYEYSGNGVKYSAPTGEHDDGVMALAMANKKRGLRRVAGSFSIVGYD